MNTVTVFLFFISTLTAFAFTNLDLESKFIQQELHTGPLWQNQNNPELLEFPLQELSRLKTQLNAVNFQQQHYSVIQICPLEDNFNDTTVLKFIIEPTPTAISHLISAELRVFLLNRPKHLTNGNNGDQTLKNLYQIIEKRPLNQPDTHRLLSVFFTQGSSTLGTWLTFNVQAAANSWLAGNQPNLGFLLPDVNYQLDGTNQPVLVLKYNTRQQSASQQVPFEIRSWRNVSVNFDDIVLPTLCIRQPWYLDFTNWGLLAPSQLDVGMCHGTCNYTSLPVAHAEHTALLSILSTPCCVPEYYKPTAIMYRQENGNFIVKVISQTMNMKYEQSTLTQGSQCINV